MSTATARAFWLDEDQRLDWRADSLCLEHPEITFVPTNERANRAARKICGQCLVQEECLTYALAHPELRGIWGGRDSRERKRLRENGNDGDERAG